jgi:MFS superfamily sulfate permease-like transporter
MARILPLLSWLPRYQPDWLRYDAVAGITLAAYAIWHTQLLPDFRRTMGFTAT